MDWIYLRSLVLKEHRQSDAKNMDGGTIHQKHKNSWPSGMNNTAYNIGKEHVHATFDGKQNVMAYLYCSMI